ncbi:MAG: bifunctional glutamate N-acetyltransferase/amino-acid acetyltransferase ArgJ, partial [Alphaproteobacteria bacterium]|nr:bifunctional glutamate N-acetyltransferase/amino-acid acetyltransferase ArgJ [Alphaproteobacteria bacterium]
SAPVLWCRRQLEHGIARAVVVNAGNANAFTGKAGADAVAMTADAAAAAVGCRPEEVFIASTGVIGEPMDASSFAGLLSELAPKVSATGWEDAARAIMTTDTYPKLAMTRVDIGGQPVHIAGFVKGSGMIAPDMATMLGFIFTDANIDRALLQQITHETADRTFNCITVDSDTSTSDTVLVFATGAIEGAARMQISDSDTPDAMAFAQGLHEVMLSLAHQVVRDGEGLSKFVEIQVNGAENDRAAHRIAMTMANSPILKAAIAGEDPNWGRVVMAVGKAGEAADRDKLQIRFGELLVAKNGLRAPDYREEQGAAYMKNAELRISVDVGIADGTATVWTCDLTHDYITINADYRS